MKGRQSRLIIGQFDLFMQLRTILGGYLFGYHCFIYPDHAICTDVINAVHPSAKLACWAMTRDGPIKIMESCS